MRNNQKVFILPCFEQSDNVEVKFGENSHNGMEEVETRGEEITVL